MRLHLTNSGAIALRDAKDFRRLDVLIDAQSEDQLNRSIARIGRREDEQHVRLAPAILRFLSSHAGEPDWEAGFTKMIDYATRAGWVDERGEVRAHITPNEAEEVVTLDEFKTAMRALPAGISVITTGTGEAVAGIVVSSLTSISAEPPLVGFFINQNSSCYPTLLASGRFVANVIGETHSDVMSAFLKRAQGPERFTVGNWREGLASLPVLADALASMECDIVFTQSIGTHRMVVGKIRKTTCNAVNPVVHFNAVTHRLSEVGPE
ncbi:MAG: flavin reductase [Burkholderiales bacterium]|nr:flavin reductase [Burkholderiales bacterium]ODU65585.1 MAG: flavin reductase [Lautropia sp. SCN 66-9]